MILRFITTLLFSCFFAHLSGAAPITHFYTADLWLEKNPVATESAQNAFFVGCLFPDIRYLGTISRHETHEKDVTAKKIRNTVSPFRAGMLHHAMVDERREHYIKKNNTMRSLNKIPKKMQVLFLKLLEDEVLWVQELGTRAQEALAVIEEEEVLIGVELSTVELWHETMIKYFNQRPSDFLKALAEKDQGFLKADSKTIKEWSRLLPIYAKYPWVRSYVEGMVADLEKVF